MEMKKMVVKLHLHDDKAKKKTLKTVSSVSGIDSISVDMKEKKVTVIGVVDPVVVVSKLRKKFCYADLDTVGPAKEPEKKKDDGKKDDGKKDGGKKDEGKKDEGKKDEGKKDGGKKDEKKDEKGQFDPYQAYNPRRTACYYVESAEENPICCVIC